jgi:hypothetical protein
MQGFLFLDDNNFIIGASGNIDNNETVSSTPIPIVGVSNTIFVGDSNANATINSSSISVSNSSANLVANLTTLFIANSSANLTANSSKITFSNSTVTFSFTPPTAAQKTAGNYFLAANGVWTLLTVP